MGINKSRHRKPRRGLPLNVDVDANTIVFTRKNLHLLATFNFLFIISQSVDKTTMSKWKMLPPILNGPGYGKYTTRVPDVVPYGF